MTSVPTVETKQKEHTLVPSTGPQKQESRQHRKYPNNLVWKNVRALQWASEAYCGVTHVSSVIYFKSALIRDV